MKRFYMIIVSLVAFVGGTMAQQHEYVELVKDAPVYSSASESSTKLSSDVESVFKAFFYNGQVFYPFTQKVIDTKGEWLQLPVGWVNKKHTRPVDAQPLADNLFNTHYVGSLMDPAVKKQKGKGGLAIDYDLYCMRLGDDSDRAIVFIALFAEKKIACTARIVDGNMIECDKFIIIRNNATMQEDLPSISFELDREGHGLKLYKMLYASHLNTEFEDVFMGDVMIINAFDVEKLTKADLSAMYDSIEQLGEPTKLCVSNAITEALEIGNYQ